MIPPAAGGHIYVMQMTEKVVASGDAEICTEAFGEPDHAPVLMIMGAMASMLWWPDGLCAGLARRERFVIRYDNRDTGRSTSYEAGAPPYTVDDLVDDAAAVLDGYGVDRAHVVGMSMGGAIAQLVALEHRPRVASLTAISTSGVDGADPELPGPDPEYLEHAAAFEELDWSDAEALAELLVRDARQIAGSRHRFDEAAARDLVRRDLRRTANPQSLANHGILSGGEGRQDSLADINLPLLVIHGTDDPVMPYAHGVALANSVPGARLVPIEGGGHELHERDWDQIIDALVDHTAVRPGGNATEPAPQSP
jgi:pimeloyl-ACP methyl ester carboxylesterase